MTPNAQSAYPECGLTDPEIAVATAALERARAAGHVAEWERFISEDGVVSVSVLGRGLVRRYFSIDQANGRYAISAEGGYGEETVVIAGDTLDEVLLALPS